MLGVSAVEIRTGGSREVWKNCLQKERQPCFRCFAAVGLDPHQGRFGLDCLHIKDLFCPCERMSLRLNSGNSCFANTLFSSDPAILEIMLLTSCFSHHASHITLSNVE